jgi:hypothetical protein
MGRGDEESSVITHIPTTPDAICKAVRSPIVRVISDRMASADPPSPDTVSEIQRDYYTTAKWFRAVLVFLTLVVCYFASVILRAAKVYTVLIMAKANGIWAFIIPPFTMWYLILVGLALEPWFGNAKSYSSPRYYVLYFLFALFGWINSELYPPGTKPAPPDQDYKLDWSYLVMIVVPVGGALGVYVLGSLLMAFATPTRQLRET